jgi:peptidoglycan/LPS O-acetylase OafA/YrhL
MRTDVPDQRVRTRARRTGSAGAAARAQQRGRVDYLDGVRGIAVLLVLMYHYWAFHLPVPLRFAGGYVGVDLFFVLSGYVITSVLIHRDRDRRPLQRYRRFISARFNRLYPALIAMLVSVVVVVWAGWRPDSEQTPAHVAGWAGIAAVQMTTFFLAAHSGTPNLVGPTWTLSIEWVFYALWPFALWQVMRLRRPWMVTAFASLSVYAVSMLIPARVWWVLPPGRIAQILAGAALAMYLAKRAEQPGARQSSSRAATIRACLGIAAILTWALAITVGPAYYGFRQIGAPVVTLGAVAVLVGGVRSRPVAHALSCRPLAAVGRASYSLYLIQYPWMYAFGSVNGPTKSWVDLALASAGIAASAFVSYRLFERPYLRRSSQSGALPRPASSP